MKKLIFFFAILFSVITIHGQSIVDKESYVIMTDNSGDILSIGKSQVESLKINKGRVFVMTSRNWAGDVVTRIISFKPSDYGYSDINAFYNYLSAILFKTYKTVYSYDSGLIDTVNYFVGDSLAFKIAYSYSGSVVSEKSAPIND